MKSRMLAVCLIGILFLPLSLSAQSTPIKWTPVKVVQTIGLGGTSSPSVTFVSNTRLRNVDLSIVPNIKPFVSLQRSHFDVIEPNTSYSLGVRLTVPYGTKTGLYDGTVHLKVGSKTYSLPLPVSINVADGAETVGPSGGSVQVTDPASSIYGTRLTIPPGALSSSQRITIRQASGVPASGIGPAIEIGPTGLAFAQPSELNFPYDDPQVLASNIVDESILGLYYYDITAGGWVPIQDVTVDTASNVVTAHLTHLSTFEINGDKLINVNDPTGSSPPYSNKPQVLLLHGLRSIPPTTGDYRETFGELAEALTPYYQVWAVNYETWRGVETAAHTLQLALTNIRTLLGNQQAKVAIIGHSMGCIVARRYVQSSLLYQQDVSKMLFLGAPHHGAPFAKVAERLYYFISPAQFSSNPSFEDLAPGSELLERLNDPNIFPLPPDLPILNVYTDNVESLLPLDGTLGDGIVPASSANLDDFPNHNRIINYILKDYAHFRLSFVWPLGIADVNISTYPRHETWQLVQTFLSYPSMLVRLQNITVDGHPNDWLGIAPVLFDQRRDTSCGVGTDVKAVYLAKDSSYLYWRIDTWSGSYDIQGWKGPGIVYYALSSTGEILRGVEGSMLGTSTIGTIACRSQGQDWTLCASGDAYGEIAEVAEGKIPLSLFQGYSFTNVTGWYFAGVTNTLCDEANRRVLIDLP